MSKYTKEYLKEEALKSMDKSGVSKEVKDLFSEKMWDESYSNMLSHKGLFFVMNFLNNINFYEITYYYMIHPTSFH